MGAGGLTVHIPPTGNGFRMKHIPESVHHKLELI